MQPSSSFQKVNEGLSPFGIFLLKTVGLSTRGITKMLSRRFLEGKVPDYYSDFSFSLVRGFSSFKSIYSFFVVDPLLSKKNCTAFLFFTANLNKQEKLFIQYSGAVSFFISVFLPTNFFSNKWSRQCSEDKHFSSSRSGFESQSCQIFLWFHWHFCQNFQLFP